MSRRRPSKFMTLIHLILGIMTCGIWWIALWIHRSSN